MYAVVLTGGKQYRVQEGDVIYVEKLNAEVESTVELTEVLAVSNGETLTVGAPVVAGAKVVAKVAAQGKAKKITVFKYKPKKDYRKKTGHRQPYTKLVIDLELSCRLEAGGCAVRASPGRLGSLAEPQRRGTSP